mmetsp:Transcript_67695/g.195675  ORF Transcript_67695/g.195675 Transcript_67695/m.195675 type:complete len:253 (-) Transcript_67695:990-1748(-)
MRYQRGTLAESSEENALRGDALSLERLNHRMDSSCRHCKVLRLLLAGGPVRHPTNNPGLGKLRRVEPLGREHPAARGTRLHRRPGPDPSAWPQLIRHVQIGQGRLPTDLALALPMKPYDDARCLLRPRLRPERRLPGGVGLALLHLGLSGLHRMPDNGLSFRSRHEGLLQALGELACALRHCRQSLGFLLLLKQLGLASHRLLLLLWRHQVEGHLLHGLRLRGALLTFSWLGRQKRTRRLVGHELGLHGPLR